MLNKKSAEGVRKKQTEGIEKYYTGVVEDNEDPLQIGRLRVRVNELYGSIPTEQLPWCNPSAPWGGAGAGSSRYQEGTGYGFFFIPVPGSKVKVHLWRGHPWFPEWYGVHWFEGEAPDESKLTPPTNYVIKTPKKHLLDFNDTKPYIRLKDFRDNFIIIDTAEDRIMMYSNEDFQFQAENLVEEWAGRGRRIKVGGNLDIDVDGTVNIRAGGNVNIDAGNEIHLNSGLADPQLPEMPEDVEIQ